MNLPTLIAGSVVMLVILSIVIGQIRGRKKGKCACSYSGSCAGCSMCSSCYPQKQVSDRIL